MLPVLPALAEPFPEEALSRSAVWEDPAFLSQFEPGNPPTALSHRRWSGEPTLFGIHPLRISGMFYGEDLAGAAESRLDFVADHHDAMLVA